MFDEDDLQPLSALQHLAFCERQWALIHLERQWAENRLTAEGRVLHERAHEGRGESRVGIRIVRGLVLRSLRLGLTGVADVVEYHLDPGPETAGLTVKLPGARGAWRPVPVEYKRGRPKRGVCDAVQLCGQALCLEEMLAVRIDQGALYYGKTRRRLAVQLDVALREETERLSARLHELVRTGVTPAAHEDRRCQRCSLLARCLPGSTGAHRSVSRYLDRMLATSPEPDP